ncbi:MAG: thiamine pyrophosphate-binding protein, partial [Candidatus Nanopelagicales bacterium]
MTTVRITTAEALVRFLVAQKIDVNGATEKLFPGVIGIFGHGNVTSLGHSLEQHRDEIPVWRGQNEQGMGLAAAAYAKAKQRRQVLIATSSIGPGATNMVTAAGVAMSN